MATVRTDIHRPSAIHPTEYEWVAFQYYGGSDLGAILAMKAERERLHAHMNQTGGHYSQHEHGGICHICGQGNISYASVFYHAISNSYIITGQDCAQKMEMHVTGDWNKFRKIIHNHLEAQAGKKKAQAILAEKGLSRCWDLYVADYATLPGTDRPNTYADPGDPNPPATVREVYYEEVTVRDIVGKLVKYGSISEKAENYLRKLLQNIDSRPEREAARKAQEDAAEPVPTGRVTITGTVISVKVQDSMYGQVTKMLVKDDRGFKVWGTRTANFAVSDYITFSAAVEPSKDDPKFGFFKRPTKPTLIKPGQPFEPGVIVSCSECGVDYDEKEVVTLDVSEGLQGEDILKFRCPKGHETSSRRRG